MARQKMKIRIDGLRPQDVKLIELDGVDITSVVQFIQFQAGVGMISKVNMTLAPDLDIEVEMPLTESNSMILSDVGDDIDPLDLVRMVQDD